MKMKLTLQQLLAKSAAKIVTLAEPAKTIARLMVERSYAEGIMIIITEAHRTYDYQNWLYSKGRTTQQLEAVGIYGVPGLPKLDRVTNARGGYSNHNFQLAFDFALLLPDGRTVAWDTKRSDNLDSLPDWSEVVAIGKAMGLEWGGDWRTFVDLPHFQIVFGLSTAELRAGKRPTQTQINAALAKAQPVVTIPLEKEPAVAAFDFVAGGEKAGLAFVYGNTGISYVPMRELAQFIGVPFVWDNEEKRAYFNATPSQVEKGEKRPLDDVKIIDGRTYVQLAPLAEAYGKKKGFADKKVTVA